MDVKKILPFLFPTKGRLSKLISEILILEQKLNKIEEQSEYFKWGAEGHFRRYTELLLKYELIRHEFNNTSLHELILQIEENKKFLRLSQNLNPIIARMIVRNVTSERISKTTEFITLKSFTDVLPPFEILREDAEILRDILP